MEINKSIDQQKKQLGALDKKRDYILTIYIILVTAYFGGITALGDAKAVLCLVLSVLALIFALVLIRDRKQHYVLEQSLEVQMCMQNNPAVSYEKAVRMVQSKAEDNIGIGSAGILPSRKWVNTYLSGIDFLALNAILVISFLPVFYSMNTAFADLLGGIPPELAFFLIYLGYSLAINLAALFYLHFELKESLSQRVNSE
jgi:hypothetical protein